MILVIFLETSVWLFNLITYFKAHCMIKTSFLKGYTCRSKPMLTIKVKDEVDE